MNEPCKQLEFPRFRGVVGGVIMPVGAENIIHRP